MQMRHLPLFFFEFDLYLVVWKLIIASLRSNQTVFSQRQAYKSLLQKDLAPASIDFWNKHYT